MSPATVARVTMRARLRRSRLARISPPTVAVYLTTTSGWHARPRPVNHARAGPPPGGVSWWEARPSERSGVHEAYQGAHT